MQYKISGGASIYMWNDLWPRMHGHGYGYEYRYNTVTWAIF